MLCASMSNTAPLMLAAIRLIVPVGKDVKKAGVVSTTFTLKLPDAGRPPASVTEQLPVVSPSGKVLPLAGVQTTLEVRSPSWASFAVTVKLTTAPALLVASTVRSLGSVSDGGVLVTGHA